MNPEEEERAIAQVVQRLSERFPAVPGDHILAIVTEEAGSMDGSPIRDFVPILVEHGARDRLRDEGATSVRVVSAIADEGPPDLTRAEACAHAELTLPRWKPAYVADFGRANSHRVERNHDHPARRHVA